jgi:hypothetical protein
MGRTSDDKDWLNLEPKINTCNDDGNTSGAIG